MKSAREVIGQYLDNRRGELGMSVYRLAKDAGLQIGQVQVALDGSKAYTIDTLLKLSTPLNLYIFFGNKDGKADTPLDSGHMLAASESNDPYP